MPPRVGDIYSHDSIFGERWSGVAMLIGWLVSQVGARNPHPRLFVSASRQVNPFKQRDYARFYGRSFFVCFYSINASDLQVWTCVQSNRSTHSGVKLRPAKCQLLIVIISVRFERGYLAGWQKKWLRHRQSAAIEGRYESTFHTLMLRCVRSWCPVYVLATRAITPLFTLRQILEGKTPHPWWRPS